MTIDGKVYKLLKAMYGLRDAGAAFDSKVLDVMNLMGVSLGKFSICVGHRKVMETLVRLVRWGDDFSLCGRRSLCNAFRDEFGKPLLVKKTAVIGPNAEMGDVQEAIHLNRLLRLYPPGAEGGERWALEADPRHVEILVSQMGQGERQRRFVQCYTATRDDEIHHVEAGYPQERWQRKEKHVPRHKESACNTVMRAGCVRGAARRSGGGR